MNLRFLAKSLMSVCSLGVLTGCYHQSTVYRAVPDVTITRPGDAGSAGPLVLIAARPGAVKPAPEAADIGGAIDRMSLDQIGVLEPKMGLLLRAQRDAESSLADLRSNPNPDTARIKAAEAKADAAHKQVEAYSHEWRQMQKKLAMANNASSAAAESGKGIAAVTTVNATQTVLMASEKKTWGNYESSFAHTLVLIIDGQPKPGQYWLTPDNSVLITSSSWSAPARTRVGLTGSIKILEVHDNRIVADVAIRETTQRDSTEYISNLNDPAYYQLPWYLTGKHTFEVTNSSDPVFEKSQVRWVTE